MTGYWWIEPRVYVRDAPQARWTNEEISVLEAHRLRYRGQYRGVDRQLTGIQARPSFEVAHRERRPVAMRGIGASYGSDPGAVFLLSTDFAELVRSTDSLSLVTEECEVLYNGVVPSHGYVLADAAVMYDGFAILERTSSHVVLQYGFFPPTGERFKGIQIEGPVSFTDVVKRDFFRVDLGPYKTKLAVSGRLAERIFSARYPGLQLTDATGGRRAPELYEQFGEAGWDDIYPA